MRIGAISFIEKLIAAPMAGVTDRPFRSLVRRLGADLAVSEMISSDPSLRATRKSCLRRAHHEEDAPVIVQIAGANPLHMADAARYNVACGAQVIDINMGCPAKKVCNAAAGSALLSDESLVARILGAVVEAVAVPVTLKIRTGPNPEQRNGVRIARLAEQAGIAALAVHGRTRVCAFKGEVEYQTIRAIKEAVAIPVIANGDIDSPQKARDVLIATGADALMIGRAAQGNPWIFREIAYFLREGSTLAPPTDAEVGAVLLEHLEELYSLYGVLNGVRVARKHLAWYCRHRPGGEHFWCQIKQVDDHATQLRRVRRFFARASDVHIDVQSPLGLAA